MGFDLKKCLIFSLVLVAMMPLVCLSQEPPLQQESQPLSFPEDEYLDEKDLQMEVVESGSGFSAYINEFFKGSIFGVRSRFDSTDGDDRSRIQFQVKLKMHHSFNEGISIRIEPQTGGDGWSSGWDDFAERNERFEPEFEFHFRRAYLENQSGQLQWQAGALPSKVRGTQSTPLLQDSSGWVDGGRVVVDIDTRLVDRVAVTGGSVDFEHADFFDRNWDPSENPYFQVQIRGSIASRVQYFAEINKVHDEENVRLNANADVKDLTGLLVSYIVTETFIDLETGENLGYSIGAVRESENWKGQVAFVTQRASDTERLLTSGPNREVGDHLFLYLERRLFSRDFRAGLRGRHCINPDVCGNNYRWETIFRKAIN